MEILVQDIRHGFRMLLKKPAFSIVAIATLALGIGANTAIFGVINGVLLSPLPYPDSERLAMLSMPVTDGEVGNTSYATYVDWRERNQSFEQVSLVRSWGGALTGQAEPEIVNGLRVSPNYFQLLGVLPQLGRDFQADEDKPNSRFVVALSHSLWQRRFNSDPEIIGKQIVLTGQPFTVVAVMPLNFEDLLAANFYKPADVWAPLGYDAAQPWACRTCQHLKAVARLKPEVSIEKARSEMNDISAQLQREHPQDYPTPTAVVTNLQESFVGRIRPALYVLLGAVGLVMLIACGNVANLLLARATQRAREIAIRTALGAGRRQIVRQLMAESFALSLVGASAGWLMAAWGTELLVAMSPAKMLRIQHVTMDARVLGFTLLISVMTAFVFGLAPALQASRQDVQLALRQGGRGLQSRGETRIRGFLVAGEFALALVLLTGAGLLVRSFSRLLEVKPGFNVNNTLTMMVPATGVRYQEDEPVRTFYRDVIGRVGALPGVKAAGVVSNLPLGGNMDQSGFHVEEKPLPNPALAPSAERYGISPDYLRAMGIPLLRGRGFTEHDGPDKPLVALINQTAARQIWNNEDPIGKRIRLGDPHDRLRAIVGIVGDVNHYGLDTPPDLQVYVPAAQWTDSYMLLVVRTASDSATLAGTVREEIRAIDRDIPVYQVATMQELVSTSFAQRRFTLLLLGVFSAVALLLAAVGIYGVISFSVTQRTQEIGIRMALGANRVAVVKLVVGQGLPMIFTGVIVGLGGALATTSLMEGLLFGVSATDSVTLVAVAGLLIAVGLTACLIPARRATKVDPMIALRYE
ncbi:MAG: ABC transporter permease [Blastocatellia bacterium]